VPYHTHHNEASLHDVMISTMRLSYTTISISHNVSDDDDDDGDANTYHRSPNTDCTMIDL